MRQPAFLILAATLATAQWTGCGKGEDAAGDEASAGGKAGDNSPGKAEGSDKQRLCEHARDVNDEISELDITQALRIVSPDQEAAARAKGEAVSKAMREHYVEVCMTKMTAKHHACLEKIDEYVVAFRAHVAVECPDSEKDWDGWSACTNKKKATFDEAAGECRTVLREASDLVFDAANGG